jgi:hypothetical protein
MILLKALKGGLKVKGILNFFLVICLLMPRIAQADCDFSKGIKPGPSDTYIYTEDCHKKVGSLVKQNSNQAIAIQDLNKALTVKDLSLQQSDKRATLWNNTASDLENRLQKVDSLEKTNNWLYFGLGVLTTFAAGYAAAKLAGR